MSLAIVIALASAAQGQAPICTDRPTKGNSVCTVPVGAWQLESTAVGWSRLELSGSETETLLLGSSLLKLGLTGTSDFQIGFTPFSRVETSSTGNRSKSSGQGDVVVRYKSRLTSDGKPVQLAVIPFVKLPTADHDLGNGKVEGGVAVPIAISSGSPVTILLGPEFDVLADSDGHGHHLALVNLVNLSAPVADRLTIAGELWTMTNFEPSGTVTLVSADAAISYLVRPDLQLDFGANVGLTPETTDIEVYVGISFRS